MYIYFWFFIGIFSEIAFATFYCHINKFYLALVFRQDLGKPSNIVERIKHSEHRAGKQSATKCMHSVILINGPAKQAGRLCPTFWYSAQILMNLF